MSKPAVAARRAISTPRTRRMVMDATTSSRLSFSLTMLRTTSLAFTGSTPSMPSLWIRQRDRQHHIAVALAVNVLRQRNRDATGQRILDYEIEGLEIAQGITPDRTLGDMTERVGDAFDGQLALQKFPMFGVVADHRDIGRVALVAGTRVGKVIDANAHSLPSTTTCGLTMLLGNNTDFTASTSRTRGSQPPPAPPGPCMCKARTSNPIACAAFRLWVRPAIRKRTS